MLCFKSQNPIRKCLIFFQKRMKMKQNEHMIILINKHYKEIHKIVKFKAYRFRVNEDDVLSNVNKGLASSIYIQQYSENSFPTKKAFMGWASKVVHNACISAKQKFFDSNVFLDVDDVSVSSQVKTK